MAKNVPDDPNLELEHEFDEPATPFDELNDRLDSLQMDIEDVAQGVRQQE